MSIVGDTRSTDAALHAVSSTLMIVPTFKDLSLLFDALSDALLLPGVGWGAESYL
jgi:hypothetical protein